MIRASTRSGLLAVAIVVFAATILVAGGGRVLADRYSSTNYTIDASVMNGFGGTGSSTNYQMVSTGGEAIIGSGTGGSYKLGQGYVAQLDHSIQLTIQPNGLAAYYSFDEGSGTVARDQGALSDEGTLSGGASLPIWGTGKNGSGLTFDGVNDAVTTTELHDYDTVTVSAWLKAQASSTLTLRGVVSNSRDCCGTYGGYQIEVIHPDTSTVNARFRVWNSSGTTSYRTPDTVSLPIDQWTHVVGTFDGSSVKIYKDGVFQQQNTSYSGTINTPTAPIRIGALGAVASSYFVGSIDMVKIFSRALSADEIKAEYDAQNAGREAGLSLGTVIPGASNTALFDAITQASTSSYNLAIHQNNNLTSGGNTIPAVSGTIASPAAWSEGTTKGLGFTLVSGTGIPGGWGSGSNYAALPGSATSFYTRTGYTPGTKDVLGMRLRLDANSTQPSGDYTNIMTITGTTIP